VTDFNASIGFDINDEDARRESDQVFDAFERRMQEAFRTLGDQLSRAFSDVRRGLGGNAFEEIRTGSRRARQEVSEFSNAFEVLEADVKALDARFRSFRDTAAQLGADPNLLAAYERELRRLFEIQRRFETDRAELSRNPALRESIRDQLRAVERGLISERTLQQSHLRDQNSLLRQQLISRRQVEADATRERIADVNRSRAQFVTATQIEGAQRLAETRVAGQRLIAEERSTQRRRIELLRFTLQQIRTLERVLGSVFSGVGATVSGATRRVASALSNLGDAFRRNNRQFTDGLQPALNRRETLISRSFREQEISISRSLLRQQQTIERFERQASTGVAGALTGRSLAGRGLVGLGLGFGGGLAGASLLTGGFQRFSNLERLQKQFEALTGSAEQAQVLLAEVAQFAKTTPFDLVGVADLAKGFLAIGTAAEDVIPRVKTIADAVALTGGNADSLVRIQRAIGQVVSAGRLQGDELNQLAENLPGLNIRQLLADQITGGNVQELVKLQEAGKLTADQFVTGLLTGLSTDPRLQGASEDLAKTLSGRLANLRESFEDFGASLIGLIANPLRQAIFVSQVALQGLSDFVKGDVSGALDVLRTAAAGAAIALGGLLVARGAAQAISILGLAVRAALTPFGIFALAVAGIGAALAVLLQRSPEVREAFSQLGEAVGDILAPAMSFVAELLEDFTDLLTRTVLPGLENFAISMAQRIGPALERLGTFVGETVLPALQRFVEFVIDTAIPVVSRGLAEAFDVARGAAVAFWEFVEPIIAPAIEGFSQLGSAVRDLVTGDLSSLLPALGAVGAGIGGTFANLGQLIFEALRGPVQNVIEFISDALSEGLLGTLARNILDAVEFVGFTLANVITDRRVVTALAGIVAAAGVVAFRFIQGLARGILDNLPDLLDAIRDLGVFILRELGSALVDNPQIILFAIAGAFVAGRIITLFRSIGSSWGRAAGQGFVSQLRGTVAGALASTQFSGQFFQGLFGGSNFQQASEDARRQLTRQIQQANRDLFALTGQGVQQRDAAGRFTSSFGPQTAGPFDARTLQGVNAELRNVIGTIGEARAAGVLFRDSFGRGLDAIRERNLPAFRQAIGDMARQIGPAARAVGVQVGNFLIAGIGAALSGQVAGTTAGVARGVGIAGVVSSALFAGLSAGAINPALGAVVGSATLAVGGLTAVLSANEQAAKNAAAEIREYSDALAGATTASELLASATDTVIKNIAAESPEVIALLDRIAFNPRLFADAVIDGNFDIDRAFRDLISTFEGGAEALAEFDRLGGGSVDDFFDRLDRRQVPGLAGTSVFTTLREQVQATGFDIGDLRDTLDAFGDEAGELGEGLPVARNLGNIAGRAQEAATNIGSATRAAGLLNASIVALDRPTEKFSSDIALTISGLQRLNDARVNQLGERIETLRSQLDDVSTIADDARERLENFLTAGSGGATDQAVTAVEGIATAVQEAGAGIGGQIIDEARKNLALGDFRQLIQSIINEGRETGLIDAEQTQADLFTALTPLSQALDELRNFTITDPITGEVAPVISQETRDALGAEIAGVINNTELDALIDATFNVEQMEADLQEQLDRAEFELNARLNITNIDEIELLLSGRDTGDRQPARSDFGPTVPPAIINIEGARSPVRVARETVRQLALQGARAAARADEGRI
jgi:tape measure domain-containing protein